MAYYYFIQESLIPTTQIEVLRGGYKYVAVLTPQEYLEEAESFGMGIDIDLNLSHVRDTKAVVNYDCLTGTLNIPDHRDFSENKFKLAFALDEKGIVFIDSDSYTYDTIEQIRKTRHWKFPSIERFIYDFLEETIKDDFPLIESTENDLDIIETSIMKGEIEEYPAQLNDIRSTLLDMHKHYEHLIDLAKELEENENGFFYEDNLRYFRLFSERVMRLQDTVNSLRDYIVQLRDLVSEQLSIKQNKIMTLLTVITSIFMPLTLIAGWYGMNFHNMPELYHDHGYMYVIIVSLLIVVVQLWWFKKKKWL